MYVIIRGSGELRWLVVQTSVLDEGTTIDLSDRRHAELAEEIRLYIEEGIGRMVAACKRREDARILATELNRLESNKRNVLAF